MSPPRRTRVVVVTNIPVPYRIPVYERLAQDASLDLVVIYCSGSEPDRSWRLGVGDYRQIYLKQRFLKVAGRFIHVNPDVWSQLNALRPDVVITTGYNPTHLVAFAYAKLRGLAHIVMTDGTWHSERGYSWVHRLVRKVVFAGSGAFVGASQGSFDLLASYGVSADRMFKSHLCADNAAFEVMTGVHRTFDLMFSGRLVGIKNPMFALDVAREVATRLGRGVSVLMIGSGDLENEIRQQAASLAGTVNITFPGFIQPAELPRYYASAKVFLFPTSWDPWGVVANEACAAGTPVLVTPEAGVSGDLIKDGLNGWIMPLDVNAWADRCVALLTDEALYRTMSEHAKALVQPFNFDAAAKGIADAVKSAVRGKR